MPEKESKLAQMVNSTQAVERFGNRALTMMQNPEMDMYTIGSLSEETAVQLKKYLKRKVTKKCVVRLYGGENVHSTEYNFNYTISIHRKSAECKR